MAGYIQKHRMWDRAFFFFEFQGAYPGWAEVLKQVNYDASPKITLLQS